MHSSRARAVCKPLVFSCLRQSESESGVAILNLPQEAVLSGETALWASACFFPLASVDDCLQELSMYKVPGLANELVQNARHRGVLRNKRHARITSPNRLPQHPGTSEPWNLGRGVGPSGPMSDSLP